MLNHILSRCKPINLFIIQSVNQKINQSIIQSPKTSFNVFTVTAFTWEFSFPLMLSSH